MRPPKYLLSNQTTQHGAVNAAAAAAVAVAAAAAVVAAAAATAACIDTFRNICGCCCRIN